PGAPAGLGGCGEQHEQRQRTQALIVPPAHTCRRLGSPTEGRNIGAIALEVTMRLLAMLTCLAACSAHNSAYNCGPLGGACCVDGACQPGATCVNNTCQQCGGGGQACCAGRTCGGGLA